MPWVKAKLRGQEVWARADAGGALAPEGGKVEIRYKPNDGRKYQALAGNLTIAGPTVFPDDHCAAAEAPAPAKKSAAPTSEKAPGSRARSKSVGADPLPEAPDASGSLIVYTDGACTGNPGPAGLGVVIAGAVRDELSEFLGHATNNIAELTAILRGIELTSTAEGRVLIHTDSQYAIGVLSKGWKAKANAELIASIRELLKTRRNVAFKYVPGHAGVPLNERADELAREAIRRRGTVRTST